jgi:hypothetical protein
VRTLLRYLALVAAVLALAGNGAVASEDNDGRQGPNRFKINLVGFQENPSISTTGNGHLDLRIDDRREEITYELVYSDLEGLAPVAGVPGVVLFAHIHVGARHVNGGVSAFLCGGGGKPPCPTPDTSGGSVEGVITANDIVGPAGQGITAGEPTAFEELVRAIRAGYTYANLHTTRWPGGEIRGQIPDHHNHD